MNKLKTRVTNRIDYFNKWPDTNTRLDSKQGYPSAMRTWSKSYLPSLKSFWHMIWSLYCNLHHLRNDFHPFRKTLNMVMMCSGENCLLSWDVHWGNEPMRSQSSGNKTPAACFHKHTVPVHPDPLFSSEGAHNLQENSCLSKFQNPDHLCS